MSPRDAAFDCVVGVIANSLGIPRERVSLDARVLHDLHLDGDDAVAAIREISRRCAVDISGFDPSLYFRSEPSLLSLLPFLPSQRRDRVNAKLPLTVRELVEAVRSGSLRSGGHC